MLSVGNHGLQRPPSTSAKVTLHPKEVLLRIWWGLQGNLLLWAVKTKRWLFQDRVIPSGPIGNRVAIPFPQGTMQSQCSVNATASPPLATARKGEYMVHPNGTKRSTQSRLMIYHPRNIMLKPMLKETSARMWQKSANVTYSRDVTKPYGCPVVCRLKGNISKQGGRRRFAPQHTRQRPKRHQPHQTSHKKSRILT